MPSYAGGDNRLRAGAETLISLNNLKAYFSLKLNYANNP
jgi:hypothetical protein